MEITIYIDIEAGRFAAWCYSEGDINRLAYNYNLDACKRLAIEASGYYPHNVKFVLTDSAKHWN